MILYMLSIAICQVSAKLSYFKEQTLLTSPFLWVSNLGVVWLGASTSRSLIMLQSRDRSPQLQSHLQAHQRKSASKLIHIFVSRIDPVLCELLNWRPYFLTGCWLETSWNLQRNRTNKMWMYYKDRDKYMGIAILGTSSHNFGPRSSTTYHL